MTNPLQPDCYHCGLAIDSNVDLTVTINEQVQTMCCLGCQGVAQSIIDNGLENYYSYRTEKGAQATELIPQELTELLSYDIDEIQQEFVEQMSGAQKSVILTVENVTCAACAWLIEKQLVTLPGLIQCNVNTTTARLSVTWVDNELKLSKILLQVAKVGYKAYPFQPDAAEENELATANAYLRKLVVAGLATMQVMMFAMANYFDVLGTLSDGLADYFRWVSFIIVLPVVFYCSQPFYANAISAILAKRLNMDVSVSLAIILSFIASVIATVNDTGEVYFESISMFAFFLLTGRFIEQRAKKKAAQTSSNILKLIPATAQVISEGTQRTVPAKTLSIGDIILVKPGQIIPADGIIVEGNSNTNEAILTGESLAVIKEIGDNVYASTENIDSPLTIEVSCNSHDRLISQIIRLQEQSSNNRPKLATLADSIAQYVVIGIISLSLLTYVGWTLLGADDAFWIAIAVLIATCPCALSLATPSAYTCANATMTANGLLVKSANAFDILAKITHVCFDKTGTLTSGVFKVSHVDSALPTSEILALCATLESSSNHPIASAFTDYQDPSYQLSDCQASSGGGIEGMINGHHYQLGSKNYTLGLTDTVVSTAQSDQQVTIYLSCKQQLLATIYLVDSIRTHSKSLIDFLTRLNIDTTILTGDASNHGDYVMAQLNTTYLVKGQSPADKLDYLMSLQQGEIVAMFGDGVNDAPVLAGAHISFAMGSGSDIAKSSADIVLLHDDLTKVSAGIKLSLKVNRIIKQNFCWAIGYNLLAVPFAIAGMLPPYLAALGMSLSSVVVITNSLRLLKGKQ